MGYEKWGSTAAVVSVVEKELTATESHIQELENRLSHLEAQLDANRSHRVAGAETSRGIKIAGEPTNLFVKGAFEAVQRKGDTY